MTLTEFLIAGTQATCAASGVLRSQRHIVLGGQVTLVVTPDPFRLEVLRDGKDVIKTSALSRGGIGFGNWWTKDFTDYIYQGYSFRMAMGVTWWHVTKVAQMTQIDNETVSFRLATNDPLGAVVHLTVRSLEKQPEILTLDVAAEGGMAKKSTRMGMVFEADHHEGFFGFGERFTGPVNKRGMNLECWTEDGSWTFEKATNVKLPKSESTYFPVPFTVSSRGYGVYLNSSHRSHWRMDSASLRTELGILRRNISAFEVQIETLKAQYVLLLGKTPAETLKLFSGPPIVPRRSLVPPSWQFGPWNQFAFEYGNRGYYEAIEEFIKADIPTTVSVDPLHFFPVARHKGVEGGVLWNQRKVRSYGLAPLAYFNSMVDTDYPDFENLAASGYFLKMTDGSLYKFKYKGANLYPFTAALIDFTNPAAVRWYHEKLQEAIDLGYKGFMYDYGEYVGVNTRAHDGTSGLELHNAYPLQYQAVAFDFFRNKDPNPHDAFAPDYVYYVRSGYAGSQAYMWSHWTGDPFSGWDDKSGLPSQLKAQLTLGLSAIPFSGSDIGGFVWVLPPTQELWLRWTAMGVVSGTMHTQTGGSTVLGYPKSHIHDTAEGTRIYRRFAKLRTVLFPYIYTSAMEAHYDGMPLMRHHILHFPHDRTAWSQDYQYMFGPAILVAPVVEQHQRKQSVYLPRLPDQGQWVDFWSSMTYDEKDGRFRIGNSALIDGGKTVTVLAPLDALPMFVRAGAIIPTLDPSLHTLLPDCGDSRVVTYSRVSHILHLWAWLDVKRGAASGILWDGSSFQIAPAAAYADQGRQEEPDVDLVFSMSDPHPGRCVVLQMSVHPRGPSPFSVDLPDGRQAVHASSWEEVARPHCDLPEWTLDPEKGTLWLKVSTALESVRMRMPSYARPDAPE